MKRAVLVIGAPRSGTSLTAHILSRLGVNFGDPKSFVDAEKNKHNPIFFELQDLNKINDEIFSFYNKTWSDFNWLPLKSDFTEPSIFSFYDRITQFIENELGDANIIGLKDPRFCFTLPVWSAILKRLGYKINYVLTNRDPDVILSSNRAINGYSSEKNFLITLESILSASYHLQNKPIARLKYESLLSQPKKEVQFLCDTLCLDSSLADYACAVIKPNLNHGMLNPPNTFKYFENISSQNVDLEIEFIKFREAALSLSSEYDKQAFKLKCAVADSDEAATNLIQNLSLRDEKIVSLEQEISHLTHTINKRDRTVSSLTQQNIKNKEQLSHSNKIVANRDNQLIELYNSTSWQVTTPVRFASHQLRRAAYAPALIKAAIKRGGGFTPTLKKAIQLYRLDRLSGIKHGLRTVAKTDYIKLPDTEFLRTINHKAGELLESRALIIAELSIPQCTKYRVKQKQEMFSKLGIDCTVLSWTNTNACINELSSHSLAIFYRVPGVPEVLSVIAEAKRLKIPTFWEVDDLIFNDDVLTKSKALSRLDKEVIKELLEGARLYKTAMLACDSGIASTTGLSAAMQKAGVPEVFVIENALDQQTLSCAENINKSYPQTADSFIRIAYGSGTNTHDIDFKEASEAILHALKSFPNVKLRILGTLELPKGYTQHESQLEKIPFCSYEEYLNYLAECDINIAPLENYIFNESKSNIKLLEASVLKIPSICSPRSAFSQAITHHKNGFLCETQDEWADALTSLVTDAELRERIAMSTYRSALKTYSLANIANQQLLPLANKYHSRRKDTKRILSVNVLYAPRSFGGATIVAEETNRILSTDSHLDIYVFTTLPLNEVSEYAIKRYEIDDICVFGLGLPDTSNLKCQFENPLVLEAFESVLSAVKPDLVHIHCIQGIGVSIAELCSSKCVKHIVTLHDAWWVCGRQFMVNRDKKFCNQQKIDLRICDTCVDDVELNRYRQTKLSTTLKNADLLLSPSQFFANFYIQNGFPADKVLVNKNGISIPKNERKLRRNGPLIFGYVGGNTDVKGVDLVKHSFIDLHEENIKLIIVDNTINLGYHSYDEHFFKGVTDIEIVPAYTQETIDSFFSRIDVLLFPTRCKESFGLTVREATARNVWVITTDAGGVVEDINHGENGFIVPFGDRGKAFSQAIKDTIHHYKKMQVGSEISLQKDQITWFEDQANELAEIYERVIQEK